MRALLTRVERAGPPPIDPGAMERMMGVLTSSEYLESLASGMWDPIVGNWSGQNVEFGETYETESEMPLAGFPVPAVKMHSKVTVLRAPLCTRGGKSYRCVVIEQTDRSDQESTKRALTGAIGYISGQAKSANSAVESIDVRVTMRLLVEPAGLVPHRYELRKSIRQITRKGSEPAETQQTETRVQTFEYQPGPPVR